MIKVFLATFMLTLPIFGWAKSFRIKSIHVVCDQSSVCKRFEDKLNPLKKETLTPKKLRERIRPYLFDKSIASFSYEVLETSIGEVLKIKVSSRRIINNISFEMNPDTVSTAGLKNLLPYYEGEYYNPDLDAEAEAKIAKFLVEAGVADPKIILKSSGKNGTVDINFKITFTRTLVIQKIKIDYKGKRNVRSIYNLLNDLKGTIYNKKEINILMGDISKDLFEEGYFFSTIKLSPPQFLSFKYLNSSSLPDKAKLLLCNFKFS